MAWNGGVGLVVVVVALALAGCGKVAADSLLLQSAAEATKTPCPGDHPGFWVCLSDSSSIAEADLETTLVKALGTLASLVGSDVFAGKVDAALTSGPDVMTALRSTNYIVEIDSYCDATDVALAKAQVGGDVIYYNQCLVERDAAGLPELPAVAGVLLHEIAHNVGYTHAETDPQRTSIPYVLGDLAEAQLGGAAATATKTRPTDGGGTSFVKRRGR